MDNTENIGQSAEIETEETQSTENQGRSEEVRERAELLSRQAELLKRATGKDMIALFDGNAELHDKVLRGEWDFADAYAALEQEGKVPEPVRSGGSALGSLQVGGMSDKEFARLDEMLAKGISVRV